ncbi:MAG: hypothetical protein JXA82_19360 [Sedimentisphaerales bacterium]|nr:hypothetical protein [Sedimentisphaerales bacterium]
MLSWLIRKKKQIRCKIEGYDLDIYPSQRSCIKQDMTHVRPQQLPPLMVRKAAWRR